MKNNKLVILLVIIIIIITPILIFLDPDILGFLVVEGILTYVHYLIVLSSLSSLISNNDKEKTQKKLLIIRIILIIVMYLLFKNLVIVIDFYLLVYGGIILFIISVLKKNSNKNFEQVKTPTQIKCSKCNSLQPFNNIYCTNCGEVLKTNTLEQSRILHPFDFEAFYSKDEESMLADFIEKELEKAGLDKKTKLIPVSILKKKKILSLIYSVLIFVYVSLIFFHFPIYTYIIGLVILVVLLKITNKYNFIDYLKKEVKSRPSEKISNIIMSTKESMIKDNQKVVRFTLNVVALLLPLIIFINPRIMYEEVEGGYSVRFYTFGLTNFKTAEIPEKYNGKPVISLRGNTFSNMPFLEEVTLPDTIVEIRGQAFKNDYSLTKVNIPAKLEYLGGGAFYNCQSIEEVELPDTLTYLGGESFYNAESLKKVKLSEKLTEIRGNTFENCSSLESINIPDNVERIGGHAFYGNYSLKEVNITENSKLNEIGSSAFRNCSKLSSITIPKSATVNEKAFKGSPTKVKIFGEFDYESLADSDKYTQYSFIYFKSVGDSQTINKDINSAIIYNTTLTLVDVKLVKENYQYTLKYKDELGEITFVIDKDNLYKEINENLIFSIYNESSLSYYDDGYFYLNAYYN